MTKKNILHEAANSFFVEWGGEDDGSSRVAELVDRWHSFYKHAGYEDEMDELSLSDLIDDVLEAGLTSQDEIDEYLSTKYLGIGAPTEAKKCDCEEKEKIEEFSKIGVVSKTVADLGDEYSFYSDSQDTDSIKDFVKDFVAKHSSAGDENPIDLDKYDSFFVKLNDAGDDYEEVWGMEGIVPNMDKAVDKVFPKLYTEEVEEVTEDIATGIDQFVKSYIETLLWASTDDDGEPLDDKYSDADISEDSLANIKKDAVKFLEDAESLIDGNYRGAGHDFFLTRNGHGAGFWDGDWGDNGDALTELSKKFGEQHVYVGDDGKVYADSSTKLESVKSKKKLVKESEPKKPTLAEGLRFRAYEILAEENEYLSI